VGYEMGFPEDADTGGSERILIILWGLSPLSFFIVLSFKNQLNFQNQKGGKYHI
jgi:hypothetical protein